MCNEQSLQGLVTHQDAHLGCRGVQGDCHGLAAGAQRLPHAARQGIPQAVLQGPCSLLTEGSLQGLAANQCRLLLLLLWALAQHSIDGCIKAAGVAPVQCTQQLSRELGATSLASPC